MQRNNTPAKFVPGAAMHRQDMHDRMALVACCQAVDNRSTSGRWRCIRHPPGTQRHNRKTGRLDATCSDPVQSWRKIKDRAEKHEHLRRQEKEIELGPAIKDRLDHEDCFQPDREFLLKL
jgi:hypothetical protein